MSYANQLMRRPFRPALRAGLFAGVAVVVAAAFATAVYGLAWIDTYQVENFGDRRLEAPRPEECRMARALVTDFAQERSALLRRAAGAADEKLEFLAFAWWSDGRRAPPGADWRKCPGLGRYVRGLGLQRMASGGMGPSLYVSRAPLAPPGHGTWFWVTFFPPQAMDPAVVGRSWTGSTTWRVIIAPADAALARTEWIPAPDQGAPLLPPRFAGPPGAADTRPR